MSLSDSSSHGAGGFRTFRQTSRDRLLQEMLHAARTGKGSAEWKVLIMDEVTVKVMSCTCKMADITDEGISLVEDLNKRRQPLPALDAVYFIQPSQESVRKFMQDMSGKSALYKKAYVFFSSPIGRDLLQAIKSDQSVLSRIAALREMNLEYLTVDTQGFITDNDEALELLFGESNEGTRKFDKCIETIATRLSTVFASMKEFPYVRYRAASSAATDSTSTTTGRDLVPTKVAAALWDRLMKYKTNLLNFPQVETCELIIVDRSIDPIAAVIHEWTYDAMCHDLLDLDGNKYIYETTNGGRRENEVLLEEHDPVWVELRDLFIADASVRLTDKMQTFASKNKAAQIKLGTREGQELSTRDMQKMVQALPQYRDQLDKLSLHIHIATLLNAKIKQDVLSDIGNLEQDFVFGDATIKELINILNVNQEMSSENKLRLLMIYTVTHPEKLDETKQMQWMKLARLSSTEMNAVTNLEFLGVQVSKKPHSGVEKLALKFGAQKIKRPLRRTREQDEESWQLSRFYPLVQDIVEDMDKGVLSKEEYPYLKDPSGSSMHASSPFSRPPTAPNSRPVQSRRTTAKGPGSTWASRGQASSDDGYSSNSVLKAAVSDPKINGKRIFIFIVGGMTRSELRVAHKLTPQLKREVVLGSTNIDNPKQFVRKLKELNSPEIVDF